MWIENFNAVYKFVLWLIFLYFGRCVHALISFRIQWVFVSPIGRIYYAGRAFFVLAVLNALNDCVNFVCVNFHSAEKRSDIQTACFWCSKTTFSVPLSKCRNCRIAACRFSHSEKSLLALVKFIRLSWILLERLRAFTRVAYRRICGCFNTVLCWVKIKTREPAF